MYLSGRIAHRQADAAQRVEPADERPASLALRAAHRPHASLPVAQTLPPHMQDLDAYYIFQYDIPDQQKVSGFYYSSSPTLQPYVDTGHTSNNGTGIESMPGKEGAVRDASTGSRVGICPAAKLPLHCAEVECSATANACGPSHFSVKD